MANKIRYFIGNWKMFGNQHSLGILNRINKFLNKSRYSAKKKKIIFCVPTTLIHSFAAKLKKSRILIGAQNCHHSEKFAAVTGSVNASMLKKSGAKYVILGHSENRIQGDTHHMIKKKIKSTLNQKLIAIFCIGESLKEKKNKKTFNVLKKQIKSSLDKNFNFRNIIIAYEPVWSIGSGKTPNQKDLSKILHFIKKEFVKIFKTNALPKVLYGGSVNNKNINKFSTNDQIDGFLIGGASRSSKKFIDIIVNYYK